MNRKHITISSWNLLLVLLALFLCLDLPAGAQQNKPGKMPVRVKVTITERADNKNLILYNREKKLVIEDFKAKPDITSPGVGATYSGILMEMQGESKDGVLQINVALTIYFDKMKSWMKPDGKNDRVLNHEQLHFDLTAIKACGLAKAINNEKFTSDKVQQKIRELQALYTKELSELQEAYDRETQHGTIADKQAGWSERIAKGMEAEDCM